jgi:hypothetical protein
VERPTKYEPKKYRRQHAIVLGASVFLTLSGLSLVASPLAQAAGADFYAFATGQAVSATNCPDDTSSLVDECSLGSALNLAAAGDTVYLATPGSGANAADYIGNWTVTTPGTSGTQPLTIEPAPGIANPILSGNGGSSTGCTTSSCDGPVVAISGDTYVDITGVTIKDGDDTATGFGGAISNADGGNLTLSGSTFLGNMARNGGAIANGDEAGIGTLTVSTSTFSGNSATNGGAIDNGDNGGFGTLTVSNSIFSANQASGDGGAVDNGDQFSIGVLSVAGSTFSGNTATDGGAIDNGDNDASGIFSVSASTFSGDNATDGGAIDNGDNGGSGILAAAASIFNDGCDQAGGVWEDEGYNVSSDDTCLAGGPSDIDNGSSLSGVLGPLSNNGGPTATILPLVGNPAIGVVPDPTSVTLNGTPAPLCPTSDERAVASLADAPCNAGAVQYVLPMAQDQTDQATEGTPLNEPAGSLLAGVTDDNPGATSWTPEVPDQPANGTVTVNSDGSFVYTPDPGFVGRGSFSYTLTDNLGYTSAPALVTINVALAFSVTANGAALGGTPYGTPASFGETGVPPSMTGTLSFSTSPGGLVLCSLAFPTTATSCGGGAELAPGEYKVVAAFVDPSTQLTTQANLPVELDVTTAPVVASVSGSQSYDAANYKLAYSDNAPPGVSVGGTLGCSSVDGGEPIGASLTASSYTIDGTNCTGLTLTGTASANYVVSYVGLTDGFVVSPVSLTVTASSASFTSGGAVPNITPSYAGFVNGDSAASLSSPPRCSTTAISSSPPGTYPSTCTGAVDANYATIYVAGTVNVKPPPMVNLPPTPATTTTTTTSGTSSAPVRSFAAFPHAQLSYPNGAIISFGSRIYVFAGGHPFTASAGQLAAVEQVDHAKLMAAEPGAVPLVGTPPRPGTLLSTHAVDGNATIFVTGNDGELHGFSTSRQFFRDGYDAALVVTVPTLAGLKVGTTQGVADGSGTALATRADGAIVDSSGTFYVFAGGRAFGISSPAALARVRSSDRANVLRGSVGPVDMAADMVAGVLLSSPGKVYVSYHGALFPFKTTAQLANDGYKGTAAVPLPGRGGLIVVSPYAGS